MKTKTTFNFKNLLAALLLLTIVSCTKDKAVAPQAIAAGKYQNGFFIINEGWYGHGTGSVSFFDYTKETITDSIFTKENTGKTLDPATSTLEFATIYKGKIYLVAKAGGPLVVADEMTMKETNRIPAVGGADFRALAGIDDTRGVVSTGKGLFPINLSTLALGTQIASGQFGDVIKAGNYIFALSSGDGLVVVNATDYTVVKKITGMLVGFAVTPDGSVWVAGGKSLNKINPADLSMTTITLPFTAYGSWAAWHPGSITASTKENTVFIAANKSFSGGTTIYKYTDGNAASLTSPLVTIATGKELYGKGVAYNASTNQLVVNTVESGFTTHFAANDLDFYDVSNGSLIKDIPFTGYYFPATIVFH